MFLDAAPAFEARRIYGRRGQRRMEPVGQGDGVRSERQDRDGATLEKQRTGVLSMIGLL